MANIGRVRIDKNDCNWSSLSSLFPDEDFATDNSYTVAIEGETRVCISDSMPTGIVGYSMASTILYYTVEENCDLYVLPIDKFIYINLSKDPD